MGTWPPFPPPAKEGPAIKCFRSELVFGGGGVLVTSDPNRHPEVRTVIASELELESCAGLVAGHFSGGRGSFHVSTSGQSSRCKGDRPDRLPTTFRPMN